jgi:hypothetical protein
MIAWTSLCSLPPPASFFVCYRSTEDAAAAALERLLDRMGQRVWRDRRNLQTADAWQSMVDAAIADHDEVIALLTPQASESEQVARELREGVRRNKRVHVFATVDATKHPKLYEIIAHLNIDKLPAGAQQLLESDPEAFAKLVLGRLFALSSKPHPLDASDFERMASRDLYPSHAVLATLSSATLARYGQYADHIVRHAARRNAAMALSAGVIALHEGRYEQAHRCLTAADELGAGARARYFRAFAMLRGVRPKHASASDRDASIALAKSALDTRPSPLIGLQLGMLLWDSSVGRSESIRDMFVSAANALAHMPSEHDELKRLLVLMPQAVDLQLPVDRQEVLGYLREIARGK